MVADILKLLGPRDPAREVQLRRRGSLKRLLYLLLRQARCLKIFDVSFQPYFDISVLTRFASMSGYVNQVSIQVAIIEQLVGQIRAGIFSTKPKNVVLVGHSFGSVISNAVLKGSPDLVDGAVLTGIGYKILDSAVSFEAWQPRLASKQSPGRWRQLDGGYVTWVDIFANVNVYASELGLRTCTADGQRRFFKSPFYDTKVVEYAEANKQPFGLMEIVTLSITDLHSPEFTGPVLVCYHSQFEKQADTFLQVISGENDLIFCNGDCVPILKPSAVERFNASSNLEVYIQPGSGHGIDYSVSLYAKKNSRSNILTVPAECNGRIRSHHGFPGCKRVLISLALGQDFVGVGECTIRGMVNNGGSGTIA